MTDPADITQHATHAQQAGAVATALGGLAVAAGAFAKVWRVVFGSPKDRAEAQATEVAAHVQLSEAALEVAEAHGEDSRRFQTERDDCKAELQEMRAQAKADRAQAARDRQRLSKVEAALIEHSACGPLIASFRSEINIARTFVDGAMSTGGSTPPSGLYRGEDVVAAKTAQQEET